MGAGVCSCKATLPALTEVLSGQPEHAGFSVSSDSRDITTAVMNVQGEAERMAGLYVTAAPEKSLMCVPQPFLSGITVGVCQVL